MLKVREAVKVLTTMRILHRKLSLVKASAANLGQHRTRMCHTITYAKLFPIKRSATSYQNLDGPKIELSFSSDGIANSLRPLSRSWPDALLGI